MKIPRGVRAFRVFDMVAGMRIQIARRAGFCMGVRRALDMALDIAHARPGPVYTFGPLIHNPQVVAMLAGKGVRALDSVEALSAAPRGTVLVRAHGVAPATLEAIRSLGHEVVNATCPKVHYVQGKIRRHARDGRFVVIVGDPGHPEVVGLQGFAARHAVVRDAEEAATLVPLAEPRLCVVAQTTQDGATFRAVADLLAARHADVVVAETICDSTRRRQEEVLALAAANEAVVIVGGRESGNTRRLAQLAASAGARAIAIETPDELLPGSFDGITRVGLTAGASTPNWLLRGALARLDEIRLARLPAPARAAALLPRLLAATGAYTALGVTALSVGALAVVGDTALPAASPAVTFLYAFGLFLLARLADAEAFALNDPGRAALLARHRRILVAVAVGALAAALAGAFRLFPAASLFLALAAVPVLAPPLLARIEGGKSVAAALAGAVAALIAPLCWSDAVFRLRPHPLIPDPTGTTLVALDARDLAVFAFVTFLFLYRQFYLDWRDMQGDRVAGSRTLPVALGVDPTRRHLALLAALCGIGALAMAYAGTPFPRALPFLLAALWLGLLLPLAPRVHAARDPELPLDLALYLPGLAALLGAAA